MGLEPGKLPVARQPGVDGGRSKPSPMAWQSSVVSNLCGWHIFRRHPEANFIYDNEEGNGIEGLNRTLCCGRRRAGSRQRQNQCDGDREIAPFCLMGHADHDQICAASITIGIPDRVVRDPPRLFR